MMLLSDIIKSIEDFAPKYIKEDFERDRNTYSSVFYGM